MRNGLRYASRSPAGRLHLVAGDPPVPPLEVRGQPRSTIRVPREFAARHVVRQLDLPAEAFPVDVHLLYQVRADAPARRAARATR